MNTCVYSTGPVVGVDAKLSGLPNEFPVITETSKFTLCKPPSFIQVTVSPTLIVKLEGV